jgi:hypothetical protein
MHQLALKALGISPQPRRDWVFGEPDARSQWLSELPTPRRMQARGTREGVRSDASLITDNCARRW